MNRTSALLRLSTLFCVLPLAVHAQDVPKIFTMQAQDVPKLIHGYRITYSLITSDAGKRSGAQYFAMTVNTAPSAMQDNHGYGGHGQIKVGQRVPVATGTYNDAKAGSQTQFQYVDVGINIDATITESPTGLLLFSQVEQSSVAPEPVVIENVREPVIRQTKLTNSSTITVGKPVKVGSIDLPDSQRHIDIEVTVEPL